jgi:DinB family protein
MMAPPREMSVEVIMAGRPREPTAEVDVLRRQSTKTWGWFEETVCTVTAEHANWWPPGTANSIGTTYLHVVINTDVELNRLIHRREPLIEGRWDGNVGQGVPDDPDRFDRWVRHVAVNWELLREYGRAVHAAIIDSLDDLTDEQLDLPVDMTRAGLGIWHGRDLYELHGCAHPYIHGGEIAVLKGLQGSIGWAESEAFRATVSGEDFGD